ncbi:unnamed protein product [Enterobius vermicularis]|uniref:Transmembrane protein 242 n=1 Tax=Enterobius vermicularis TaxID=51028 RepID=A0A3P6I0K4_ENTVE|nr:unnamed protein product [Enterobius vermicularis]
MRTSFTCKITDFGFFHVFELPIFSILVCAAAAGASLGVGIRSARKYTKESKVAGYSQARLNSGVNFASRALALSTVITVSGYTLLVIGISSLLNVNTPRQFGDKMKELFGDKFRLQKKESVSSFREVLR